MAPVISMGTSVHLASISVLHLPGPLQSHDD